MEIYEEGRPIGTFCSKKEGLFLRADCSLQADEKLHRVYLAHRTGSLYVGIPDRTGRLTARIPYKNVPEEFCCVSSAAPRGEWSPWRGELDGVPVESALIKKGALALPAEDAKNFPAWDMKIFHLSDREMVLVPLGEDGSPILTELTKGEPENEADTLGNFNTDLSSDLPAGDSGSDDGGQTDCSDL